VLETVLRKRRLDTDDRTEQRRAGFFDGRFLLKQLRRFLTRGLVIAIGQSESLRFAALTAACYVLTEACAAALEVFYTDSPPLLLLLLLLRLHRLLCSLRHHHRIFARNAQTNHSRLCSVRRSHWNVLSTLTAYRSWLFLAICPHKSVASFIERKTVDKSLRNK
jgi:hypothetical protein